MQYIAFSDKDSRNNRPYKLQNQVIYLFLIILFNLFGLLAAVDIACKLRHTGSQLGWQARYRGATEGPTTLT